MKRPDPTELTGIYLVSWVEGPQRWFDETAHTSLKSVFDGTGFEDNPSVRVFELAENTYRDITEDACRWLFERLVDREDYRCPALLRAYGFEDDFENEADEAQNTPSLADQHSTLNHNQQGI